MLRPDTALAFALGVLITAAVFGWLIERRERKALSQRVKALEEARDLAGNRLHWQTVEDVQARGVNAALLISAALKDMNDALNTLAPHLRSRRK